jgi:hypothetical protein
LIAVALCIAASLTAPAGTNPRSIVGLWDVHYSSDGEEYFHTAPLPHSPHARARPVREREYTA